MLTAIARNAQMNMHVAEAFSSSFAQRRQGAGALDDLVFLGPPNRAAPDAPFPLRWQEDSSRVKPAFAANYFDEVYGRYERGRLLAAWALIALVGMGCWCIAIGLLAVSAKFWVPVHDSFDSDDSESDEIVRG